MRYSSFVSVDKPDAASIEETWDQFVARLAQPVVTADKRAVGLFCGATFSDGKRRNTSAEHVSFLVLDFDNSIHGQKVMVDTPVSIDLVEAMLQGYAYVIVTSHSNTAAWPRFRVVVPVAQPVEARLWGVYSQHALRELGLDIFDFAIDPCYRTVSQSYYWPSHPSGAPHYFGKGDGKWLDGGVPAQTQVAKPGKKSASAAKHSDFTAEQIAAYWNFALPEMEQANDGREWLAKCPLHGGVNLKFNVNPATGMWHCKSKCKEPHKGGDIYRFHELRFGVPFMEAKKAVHSVIGGEPGATYTTEELEALIEAATPEMVEDLKREIAKQPTKERNQLTNQLITTHQLDPAATKGEIKDLRKVVQFPGRDETMAANLVQDASIEEKLTQRIPDEFGLCLDPRRYEMDYAGIHAVKPTVSRASGAISLERQEPPVADKPIWPAVLGNDLATNRVWVKLAWHGSEGYRHEEWHPVEVMSSRDGLAKLNDAPVGLDNVIGVSAFLRYAKTAVVAPMKQITSAIGWVSNETRFVLANDPEYEYIGPALDVKGTVNAWKQGLFPLLEMGEQGYLALAVLGLSAASPLVRLVGRRNPVIGLVAESSKGKGKVIEYGLSIWGAHGGMTIPANSSAKGIQDIGLNRPDFPIFVDELQQTYKKDEVTVEDNIYYFGNGQRRVTSSKDQKAKGGERRYGVTFFAAEEDVVQALQRGAQNRVIALYGNPLRDAKMAAILQACTQANCGAVGVELARVFNDDYMTHLAEVELTAIDLGQSGSNLRGDDPYAVALVKQGLKLLSTVTGVALPVEEATAWLVAHLGGNRASSRDTAEDSFVYLMETLLSLPWGQNGAAHDTLSDGDGFIAFRMTQASTPELTPMEVNPTHPKVIQVLKLKHQTEAAARGWSARGWIKPQDRNLKWVRGASKLGQGARVWRITREGLALLGLRPDFEPISE